MSKDDRICLFSALVVDSVCSWAGTTPVSFMEKYGLHKLGCLLVAQTFPNQSDLSNKRAKLLRTLITTFSNYGGPSRRPTKGLCMCCREQHQCLTVVPHSLQMPRHQLWPQLCRPAVIRQGRSSVNMFATLKHSPSKFCSIAVMSFLQSQPFWGIYLLQNRTQT